MSGIHIPGPAFAVLDRQSLEDFVYLTEAANEKEPFDHEYTERFIADFSKCEGDAQMWLEDQGIHKTCIASAELLRTLARAWVADKEAVYAVVGSAFFAEMGKLAFEVWCD